MIYFVGSPIFTTGIENTSIQDVLEFFKDKSEIAFDTETTGFDPYRDRLLSYQLGNGEHQFVIDASVYPLVPTNPLYNLILSEKTLIIHNAKFDLKFLYHRGMYPKNVWDTYLGECVIYKGDKTIRKSLEAAVQRYFKYQLTKSTRGIIFKEGFSPRVIDYCAEDVKFLVQLKEIQTKELTRLDLVDSMSLENLFVKVLTYVEYSGIKVDRDLWVRKIEDDKLRLNRSKEALDKWIIDNNLTKYVERQLDLFSTDKKISLSWASSKQVVELFKDLGIDTLVPDEKTGKMKHSVEASVVEKQKNKSTIIPIYLEYKKNEKVVSTYGDSFLSMIHPKTGRIHTSFTQIMNTGRMSSGGKQGEDKTVNLQNIPRVPEERLEGAIYERECFIPEKGNVFVNADYSGQEQIVFANWSLDKDILEFYHKDLGDMHAFIASKIFPELREVSLRDIKKFYKDKRQIAKSAGFAINYGGNGNTIAENLNISQEEGDAIYTAYFEAFPGISSYFKKVTKDALKTGYILFNPISKSKCFIGFYQQYLALEKQVRAPGFWAVYRDEKSKESKLFLDELKPLVKKYFKLQNEISKMALNYPIQGSSAEITKLASIFIFDYILKNNLINIVKFANIVHDEVLLECPEVMGNSLSKVVTDCMARAGNIYCKTVPLKADAKVGLKWDH